MKSILFLSAFLLAVVAHGHPRFMYISVQPISCQSYNYNVELWYSMPNGSDVLFSRGEVFFGDGKYYTFAPLSEDHIIINNDQRLYKVALQHAYPGPGEYKITFRQYNRDADVANMDNSVNTPFYVETTITIDPYLGCNHTPIIENIPLLRNKSGFQYFNDFSIIDEDNDSLSFYFTTPLQDFDSPVVNYWFPVEKDESKTRNISKLSLDPSNGALQWNLKKNIGMYAAAFVVDEWRKVDGEYYKMSSSTIDYLIDILEVENQFPKIPELQDTAIIVGNQFAKPMSILDPDGDSLLVHTYGDFFHLMDEQPNEHFDFAPGPVEMSMDFTPFSAHVRAKPYKAIYSATDKVADNNSLNSTKSMYIWITDRDHEPEAPENFIGQAISKNLINIYWDDSDDELGYIVERADSYFSEFVRLVILPADATYFNDSSVIENNTYQYRITAVGTKMSAKKTIEVTTPDIITGIAENIHGNGAVIYPNPNNGSFKLANLPSGAQLVIKDLSGRDVFKKQVDSSERTNRLVEISTKLATGIYCVQVNSASYKMIVN